jgi:hypothetical protein
VNYLTRTTTPYGRLGKSESSANAEDFPLHNCQQARRPTPSLSPADVADNPRKQNESPQFLNCRKLQLLPNNFCYLDAVLTQEEGQRTV